MDLATLTARVYSGLSQEQIARLLPLETDAILVRSDDARESIQAAFKAAGIPFTQDHALFYGALAQSLEHPAMALYWYGQLRNKSHFRALALSHKWFKEVLDSFQNQAEGAKFVLPAFRDWLKQAKHGHAVMDVMDAIRIVGLLSLFDLKIYREALQALTLWSVHHADERSLAIVQDIRRLSDLELTKKEAREYLRLRIQKTATMMKRDTLTSPISTALEIKRLGLSKQLGPQLRKKLVSDLFSLADVQEALTIVDCPLRENDLLQLRDVHRRLPYCSHEIEKMTHALIAMNGGHILSLWDVRREARDKELIHHHVREADVQARLCQKPLTIAELREQLNYFDKHAMPSHRELWIEEQQFARQLLSQLLFDAHGKDPTQNAA